MPPPVCPNCGAEVPPNAKACPECGSDEQTGWSEEAHASGLDLPDDTFDYEGFTKREFGSETRPSGLTWFWWIIALIVLGAFLAVWFL